MTFEATVTFTTLLLLGGPFHNAFGKKFFFFWHQDFHNLTFQEFQRNPLVSVTNDGTS